MTNLRMDGVQRLKRRLELVIQENEILATKLYRARKQLGHVYAQNTTRRDMIRRLLGGTRPDVDQVLRTSSDEDVELSDWELELTSAKKRHEKRKRRQGEDLPNNAKNSLEGREDMPRQDGIALEEENGRDRMEAEEEAGWTSSRNYVPNVVLPPISSMIQGGPAIVAVSADPVSEHVYGMEPGTTPTRVTGVSRARSYNVGNTKKPLSAEPRILPRTTPIPRNPDGTVDLPLKVGIITLMNLGTIVVDHEGWHNERYIWPKGYEIRRSYPSLKDPEKHTMMTARIEQGEDGLPVFVLEPEDEPGKRIVAGSSTGAWVTAMRQAQQIRGKDASQASVSGPDYFGFSHAVIASLIQELPHAKQCDKYQWQTFIMAEEREPQLKERGTGGRWVSKKRKGEDGEPVIIAETRESTEME